MSPLFRSSFRLIACAVPVLAVAISAAAHAEDGVATAPVSSAGAPAEPAAFAVTPPSGFVFLQPGAAADGASSSKDVSSASALPEAPQPAVTAVPEPDAFLPKNSKGDVAPKYALTIPSGWTAQHISAGDKVVIGLRNLASPISLAGTIISAGYSHLTDGQPNYGVDGTAFAQRFGAGVARSASQDLFTNSILAPMLREDPRYYVLGPEAKFFHRVVYAATRPLVTRTDSGHTTVNAALLIGYAGAAALTPTYYPPINHNFHDEASTYGTSLGGAAIGFLVSEFSDQLFKIVHMKH